MSNLFAWVEFGPIVNQWDYETYCTPPPPFFAVIVDWISPDDPTCRINVFMGIQAVCAGIRGGYIIRGQGHIWLDNSDLPWNGWCITWPLICGMNHFRLEIGPLFPSGEGLPDGNYRISLISWNYFLWPKACDPERHFTENWVYNLYATDSREFQINGDIGDQTLETGLHYFGVARNDSIYNGGTLHVFSDYRLKCKVYSFKSEALMPETLIGELVPEGRPGNSIILERSPDDDELSCDPDYPLSHFAYTSVDLINPADLWPGHYDWDRTARQLSCNFGAEENDLDLPASIVVYVLANLNLDRLNDSTECFIPVICETMDFEFKFSEDLNLDDNSYIGFIVRNGNYEWVYHTPLIFGDANEEPGGNDWGIPDPPQMYTIPILWDGRDNQDNPGHFVDPDLGPYQAYVIITEDQTMIMSNIEGFNVVPMIDSVLVTHHGFYPPTQDYPTTVYSVIRGKIDDSDDPSLDYRYYIPPPDPPYQNPTSLGFWKNENNSNYYKFRDVDGEKFYENNNSQTIDLNEWDPQKFGELQYRWMAIKDQRIGLTNRVSYDNVVDTTAQWGDSWDIELIRPWMWWRPETTPYMRILTYSIIDNVKNGYLLQGGQSATGADAHKLIFMDEWAQGPDFDMPDWAVSHIGVPYTYGVKTPYISNDCGGFVTASRIEELGPGTQHDLSIDRINTLIYYRGQLPYNGRTFTEHVTDPRQDPDLEPGYRGLMVFIYNRLDNSDDWRKSRHILIVEKLQFFEGYPGFAIPRICRVLHAKGGKHVDQEGRVRFENAVRIYPFYFPLPPYNNNEWVWTFLKFVE
jgi:hypothetical protein